MKADAFIIPTKSQDGSVITLTTLADATLTVAGCSTPCSSQAMSGGVNQVSIGRPDEAGNHLIAIRVLRIVRTRKNSQYEYYNFLIPISFEGNRLEVDLEVTWVPAAERLLHFEGSGLQITIGEDRFITDKKPIYQTEKNPVYHYGIDGHLICRYAAGLIDEEDFRTQAMTPKRDFLAELQECQERIIILSAMLEETRSSLLIEKNDTAGLWKVLRMANQLYHECKNERGFGANGRIAKATKAFTDEFAKLNRWT